MHLHNYYSWRAAAMQTYTHYWRYARLRSQRRRNYRTAGPAHPAFAGFVPLLTYIYARSAIKLLLDYELSTRPHKCRYGFGVGGESNRVYRLCSSLKWDLDTDVMRHSDEDDDDTDCILQQ